MQNTFRQLSLLMIICILHWGCSKEQKPVTCDVKIIEQLGSQVSCSSKRGLEAHDVVLAKGDYKGEEVYFLYYQCPLCNTIPPLEGYVCIKDEKIAKIAIEDFNNNVTELTVVKGCEN